MDTNGVRWSGAARRPYPTGHLRAARSTPLARSGSWPSSCRSPDQRSPSTCACSKTAAWSSARAEGTRRIYRLNPDGVTALRAYLDRVWEEALTAFGKATQAAPVDPEQEDQ